MQAKEVSLSGRAAPGGDVPRESPDPRMADDLEGVQRPSRQTRRHRLLVLRAPSAIVLGRHMAERTSVYVYPELLSLPRSARSRNPRDTSDPRRAKCSRVSGRD